MFGEPGDKSRWDQDRLTPGQYGTPTDPVFTEEEVAKLNAAGKDAHMAVVRIEQELSEVVVSNRLSGSRFSEEVGQMLFQAKRRLTILQHRMGRLKTRR